MQAIIMLLAAILLIAATGAAAVPLCTIYTIKERVPRTFVFEIQQEATAIGKTFVLNATVDSEKGSIYCTSIENDRADCRVSNNPNDAVVVKLNPGSADRDNMGSIVTGFSAGSFSIGKGGWQLKCYGP